jgi:hypothetical protein
VDIERLGSLADLAKAELETGERYGQALANFLVEFEHDVLFDMIEALRECNERV